MNVPIASDLLAPGAALPMDADPRETQEWREAFEALIASQGPARARFVLDELARLARARQLGWQPELNTPALNTIAAQDQPVFPGDLAIEERLGSLIRWNVSSIVTGMAIGPIRCQLMGWCLLTSFRAPTAK